MNCRALSITCGKALSKMGVTKGDRMRPLRLVSKSHAKLAAALCAMGHQVSKSTIPKLLGSLQYRRQANRKTLESSCNPDRDAQYRGDCHAGGRQAGHLEPIGPYKNAGSDYRPKGCPERWHRLRYGTILGVARQSGWWPRIA